MTLPDGLYDLLLTKAVLEDLRLTNGQVSHSVTPLDGEDASLRLSEAFARDLARILDDLGGQGLEQTNRQLELVNGVVADIRRRLSPATIDQIEFAAPPQILRAVHKTGSVPDSPETGLLIPWLFTSGKGSPSLLSELRRELSSCDSVDILVSFITLAGVRKLIDILKSATAVDSRGMARTRIRVLTTTYMGATEVGALNLMAGLPGCEIKVSLDGRRTRLHAKAWLFQRHTGFGSAYVGSANLSGAALLGGLEWTVKITQRGQAELFERANAHFETLWEDDEFQRYDASNPIHQEKLREALLRESGQDFIATPTFFDIEPKAYQHEMLDQLALERDHARNRNLVVAATGTGKTVVAAFDYRRICEQVGGQPRLLFIAHREEILRQALRMYREVLRDNSFGALLIGGGDLNSPEHLFATIDSATSRELLQQYGPDFWHTVVIDECHRLAADRFHRFVTSVAPKVLLGLTATPERSDGRSILGYFDNRPDGSPAVELRLWHALELQLLCPFEYYACDDDTDFGEVPWNQPGEIAAVDQLVTGNHARARLVLGEWRRLCGDPARSKALVFCVSVAHARFMTEELNKVGVRSVCVVGDTPADERRRAPERLVRGEITAIVTCDLYNEGVDLPMVDTLLLLRPTQSPVLFQQQIGRGLRLKQGKESCLVLDFVGRHRTEFRFDRLLGSITGLSKRQLIESVEKGFGLLPPGCHIQLQRQAREQVLASLRAVVNQNWKRMTVELRAYSALRGRTNVTLSSFLHDQSIELSDVYRNNGRSGWTNLRRDAELIASEPEPDESYFSRRFADLLHIDDSLRADLIAKIAALQGTFRPAVPADALLLQMLAYQIDGRNDQIGSGEDFLARLQQNPEVLSELQELAVILESRIAVSTQRIPGLDDVPLCLHASYGAREILTAVGWLRADRRVPFQAGVLPIHERKTELLFVTLDKRVGYHERVAYHDYAISNEFFHWQSQNAAGSETVAGKRYLESATNGWAYQLFVRSQKDKPYRACGPVRLERAEGSKPMTIWWRFDVPLPVRLFQEFSILRGAA